MANTIQNSRKRKNASFLVEILRQEHASWQGRVLWLGESEWQYFRSELELIRLIDGFMESKDACGLDENGEKSA